VTSTTANFAILDTSVYIDNLRSGRFKQEILDLKFVVRLSAVVLAELSMGARSIEMKRLVDDLAKTSASSLRRKEAGFSRAASSAGLSLPKGFDIHKTREIHFDVLIAPQRLSLLLY
jgi:hypothetical protein